ncbi:MAG: pilus assembly protein N-terminal domain-containing protein [Pseudomonadales bacterium]|nr:pilus assembly protein N-terminal domain-containing protein [Pseudomonadales bacterium]NRA15013.1 pilus assembly protein N-terminal domain-containing protein [Oceanospirillaceae bacterium]
MNNIKISCCFLGRCRWLAAVVLLLTVPIANADNFRLFVGQMKTLPLVNIDRVAVGNAGLVSTSIMNNGELLILAEKAGDTEIQIWLKDGETVTHKFYIIPANTARNVAEVRSIVGKVAGLSIRQVGSNIILKGAISHKASAMLKKVTTVYTNVLDLTSATASNDLAKVFEGMKQLQVRSAGDKLVVSGEVSARDKAYIEAVKDSYPELVDLTVSSEIVPMVYMKVQITELGNKASENLGIKWDISTESTNPVGSFTTLGNFKNSITGGISGDINVTISAAISDGSALLLASPTLSALSGSEADFFAGGSFPIKVINDGKTSIEFKDYGLSLKIKPVVGANNRITTSIATELSDIDRSVAVDGIPGVTSRKTATQVSLEPGQTFAISGLINRSMSRDVTRFPYLSKVPIFGALFKSKNFINNKSNLVIFITPYIVSQSSDINQQQLKLAENLKADYLDETEFNLEIIE